MTASPAITVTRLPGQPERYSVCTGGGTYEVHASGACSCPAYRWRHAGTPGSLCKHGLFLLDHLQRQRACAACGGKGRLAPRLVYIGADGKPDTTALRCAACGGSGLRAPETPAAGMSNDALLRLFG
jgi:hypothetical protein